MQTQNNTTPHTSPKVVRASLRLVISDTQEEKRLNEIEKRIRLLQQQSQRRLSKYVKIKTAAAYLEVDESFLRKRMYDVFEEGVHFYRMPNSKSVRWDLESLDKWAREDSTEYADFIDNMLPSLCCSDWSESD